jgi:two-component system OmpR family sensor kinase
MKYANSLIFSITIVFLLSIASIATTFYYFNENNNENYHKTLMKEYVTSIEKTNPIDLGIDPQAEIEKIFYTSIVKDYRKKVEVLIDSHEIEKDAFREFNLYLLEYKKDLYFFIKSTRVDILIQTQKKIYTPMQLVIMASIVISILIALYVYIIFRIIPLRSLKNKIDRYGEGEYNISFAINGNDEIANVANSLEKSIKKIRKMRESRDLFLRNVMHELKTPITKGKILAEMIDNEKRKESLKGVFSRLETMIKEFVFVEQMVAKEGNIELKECRVVDLIDEAIDMSMIDRDNFLIETSANLKIDVDFKFFSVAIKNLLDNAIKYSPDKLAFVVIRENEILFKNRSNKLKHPIEYYMQPFVKETHAKSDSFGLGLYIINSIIKLHKMKFEYEYVEGMSIFKIKLNRK